MFGDLSDLMWAKEMPHKDLVMRGLYHLPGILVLAGACVLIRMLLEEILKHVNGKLARARVITYFCVAFWLWAVLFTPWTDQIARGIRWDRVVEPPVAAPLIPGAPNGAP